MIKFGTKLVCINDTFSEEQKAMIPKRPVRDNHYTVDEVLITRRGKAITLVELDNPPLMHPSGAGTFILLSILTVLGNWMKQLKWL